MNKGPGFWAIIFIVALLAVYFGLPTKSPEVRANKQAKALEVTGLENLVKGSMASLNPTQKAELDALNEKLGNSNDNEDIRLETLKSLSGFWFSAKKLAIAGAYAKKVAEILKSDTAWSICGTTFMYGLEEGLDEKERMFCFQGATEAFESAISLNPKEPEHSLNLALTQIKMPGDNPMKGILMLRDLEKQYPDYLPIQENLIDLAMKTGQWDRAKARLEKLLAKESTNKTFNCLMVQVLTNMGHTEEVKKYQLFCK